MEEDYLVSDIKCISGKSAELVPPDLKSTPLFYNFPWLGSSSASGIGRINAKSQSGYSVNLIDTGFQIAQWPIANLIKN